MVKNVTEEIIVPVNPKVLPREQVSVYIPTASNDNVGIASYDKHHFNVVNGKVSILPEFLHTQEEISNMVRLKLDRIILDEFGDGADPIGNAAAYNNVGTQDAAYVEHYGGDGSWRPMLYRVNNGDSESKLKCSRIPITDSVGKLKVVAPDGTVSATDAQNSAVPQHYADTRYVRTIDSTSTMDRAYIRTSGGANSNRPISAALTEGTASIPVRDKSSQNFHVGPTTKNNHPINATQLINRLSLELDRTNYVMTLVYTAPEKVNGDTRVVLGTIDLPMESVVVNGRVEGDYLHLELVNGEEVSVQIDHLIDPIYDKINEVRADLNEIHQDLVELQDFVTSELGDVLDEIIALQDYYTGATFDELHEYATNVAEGGVQ